MNNDQPQGIRQDPSTNRLALAVRDMQDALRYLDAHDELDRLQQDRGTSEFFDHCEGLLIAAIVAYCRPYKYSQSKGDADRCIVASKIDALANRMPLHDLVMFKRDKFIAHADWVARPTKIVNVCGRIVDRHTPVPIVREGLGDLAEFRTLITEVATECAKTGYIADLLANFDCPAAAAAGEG
ncbi:hypothetical protein [Janthinobacterium sp. HLS12-2]|uniref:hypothetical protein n=1 Tax=Janthinobacterium sp. HLS12-2 TaxID=1259324 RepID=UPI003F284AA9